jgi:hypothetical protein
MSQQVTGKKLSTARILILLSVLLIPWILLGSHKLYLGKHISWFLYFVVPTIFIISIVLFYPIKELEFILSIGVLYIVLIQILSIVDFILLCKPKYQERLSKVIQTKPFMNEFGQYPINNSSFVYVVLGSITFLSIICFGISGKIICSDLLSKYLGDATSGCIWLVTGDKNNLLSLSGAIYRELDREATPIFTNLKSIGIILLFIGGMIFLWHYQSKSKRSFSQNNQNISNIPNNNFQSNDEVTNALDNLKRLYDNGVITEAEYNEKRQKYLDSL